MGRSWLLAVNPSPLLFLGGCGGLQNFPEGMAVLVPVHSYGYAFRMAETRDKPTDCRSLSSTFHKPASCLQQGSLKDLHFATVRSIAFSTKLKGSHHVRGNVQV